MKTKLSIYAGMTYLFLAQLSGISYAVSDEVRINQSILGFRIPDFSQFLSFAIRLLFVIAGLLALFYMLWGALTYVTSGGDSGKTEGAQKKIVAAVIGVILIIATLSVIVALEQVVFKKSVCFGISCPLTIPGILNPINRKVDMDGDGLANGSDADTDGDGKCNVGGVANPNANPGNSPEGCDGEDADDDDDGIPDGQEPAGGQLDPTVPNS